MGKTVYTLSSGKTPDVCYTVGRIRCGTAAVGADSHVGGRSSCTVSIMEILELQTVSQSVWTSAKEFDKAVASVQYFY